jgi:hypothetical protein
LAKADVLEGPTYLEYITENPGCQTEIRKCATHVSAINISWPDTVLRLQFLFMSPEEETDSLIVTLEILARKRADIENSLIAFSNNSKY